METKKNKYDTNPLDPDVERKSQEEWGEKSSGAPTTPWVQGPTREVVNPELEGSRKNVYSEAPTRRYDNPSGETPYPSVFVPPTYVPPVQYPQSQNVYQAPISTAPTSRPIAGIGIPEKWAVILPYAPFYVGLVISLLELFLVPRKEVRVRFHASQAVALNIGILMLQTIFKVIGSVTGSSFGGFIVWLAAFVFFIISMIRVWRGEPHRIAPLAEPAQWFNEHIEPRNQG